MITNKQILEANLALPYLLKLNLPIKSSLKIAKLSAEIDSRVSVFAKVRDALIKNYQIKISAGETADKITFSTTMGGEDSGKYVIEFNDKINELTDSEVEDIDIKISIPDDINIPPEAIKSLLPFLEVVDAE